MIAAGGCGGNEAKIFTASVYDDDDADDGTQSSNQRRHWRQSQCVPAVKGSQGIYNVCFSSDGRQLAVGGSSPQVTVIDLIN